MARQVKLSKREVGERTKRLTNKLEKAGVAYSLRKRGNRLYLYTENSTHSGWLPNFVTRQFGASYQTFAWNAKNGVNFRLV